MSYRLAMIIAFIAFLAYMPLVFAQNFTGGMLIHGTLSCFALLAVIGVLQKQLNGEENEMFIGDKAVFFAIAVGPIIGSIFWGREWITPAVTWVGFVIVAYHMLASFRWGR